eukprot:2720237-Prymnesium_polylepis.1
MPLLPDEIWTHIYKLLALDLLATERSRAATSIAAHFNPFRAVVEYTQLGSHASVRKPPTAVQNIPCSPHPDPMVGAS